MLADEQEKQKMSFNESLQWEKKLITDQFAKERKALEDQIQAVQRTQEEAAKASEARARAQELIIGELNKEKLDLGRVISDLHLQIKVLSETLRSRESMIVEMRSKIEPPLEMQNIHLQQRNKFYQQQLRMMKIKHE